MWRVQLGSVKSNGYARTGAGLQLRVKEGWCMVQCRCDLDLSMRLLRCRRRTLRWDGACVCWCSRLAYANVAYSIVDVASCTSAHAES